MVPFEEARAALALAFGGTGGQVVHAAGRVNLIGDHTDYHEGFVLPLALDRGVTIAFALRADRAIRAYSTLFGEGCEIALDTLAPRRRPGWPGYVAGVAWAMQRDGMTVPGLDLAIASDLPSGAGLSSSAALEIAMTRAVCAATGVVFDPLRMARLARQAEVEFVGVPCGIMDQLTSAEDRVGHALLIDCRSLERRAVPMPAGAALVIMDSGVTRALAASGYADRQRECERALGAIRALAPEVRTLRDVDAPLLARVESALDPVAWRRVRHVVDENARPRAMADALAAGAFAAAGRLMNASHASLRDLYDVSTPELDALAARAQQYPACHGARMTGAGFGGCVVALVDAGRAAEVVRDVAPGHTICGWP